MSGFSLREDICRLVRSAAEAGVLQAWRLAELTPREIELELSALAARRRLELERADAAAWLTGRYVLTAVHAPRRYPARPGGVAVRHRNMTDADMKKVFAAMAERRHGNGDG